MELCLKSKALKRLKVERKVIVLDFWLLRHLIGTGIGGKEPPRHGHLLLEQAGQQEGCHRPLRLWLP